MKSKIILFILGFIVWCMLNWVPDWEHIVVGIPIAFLVAALTGGMFVGRTKVFVHPERYLWFLYYIPLFVWECVKANIDVAYRVIHPMVPINPGIVKIKTGLKTETGLTFLANSITLTPGTLSVDVDQDKGIIYVHWIDVKSRDVKEATEKIAGRFEPILKKVFE